MSLIPSFREAEILVREAHRDDGPFILALARGAFLAYGSYDRYLEDWFGNETVRTDVAEIDGRPAGFFMLTTYADPDRPADSVADLVAIAVAPELQSRGVGKRLLARALELARASEPAAREVWLVVAEGNARAQRFFGRSGFRLGAGVGVYPAGQRAIRMVKLLGEESP